jgi:Family of unknown function (DUF6390)
VSLAGALKFGRYAFPPNQLGYCGPDDNQALFEYVAEKRPDEGLVELGRRFEGAYPYLRLIAGANGVDDPFDERVVEAYWIGSPLLGGVGPRALHDSMTERFKPRMSSKEFGWLEGKMGSAKPHHNFHVFDIYVRTGLMRGEKSNVAVTAMDSCRISWGRVLEVDGAELAVERPELVYTDGKLALSKPQPKRVTRQFNGRGFVEDVKAGDVVSIHWDWACDVLTASQLEQLCRATARCLELANQTI